MPNLSPWLQPGMRVKRWLALSLLGTVLLVWGLLGLWPADLWTPGPGPGLAAFLLGVLLLLVSIRQALDSVSGALLPRKVDSLGQVMLRRRRLGRGPHIVALGGGTGLSVLLRGLKEYTYFNTAIVAVTDEGGSSGRLRAELGMPPPGDIRNCLVALADAEPLMEKLFQHRFREGDTLAGHSLGNLLLAGLTEDLGDFRAAISEASQVLAVRGQVLPATLDNITLSAVMEDGSILQGETTIAASETPIQRLSLVPDNPQALEEAVEAINGAEAIIMGPGSLYTSILPNLLVKQLADAVRDSGASRLFICNVMTQPGETDGYTAADHLQAVQEHVGPGLVDVALVNVEPPRPDLLRKYREEGSYPVQVDERRLHEMGVRVEKCRVISKHDLVRHDPDLLARAILRLVFPGLIPGP